MESQLICTLANQSLVLKKVVSLNIHRFCPCITFYSLSENDVFLMWIVFRTRRFSTQKFRERELGQYCSVFDGVMPIGRYYLSDLHFKNKKAKRGLDVVKFKYKSLW